MSVPKRWRLRKKLAGAGAVLALSSPLAVPSASASPYTVGSPTWSGFAHLGNTWQARGVLRVPNLNCTTSRNAAGASWVGIDGAGNDVVEQTGVTYGCSAGRAWEDVWRENYPADVVTMPVHIYQHDLVALSVTYNGSHQFTFSVRNETHPGSYSIRTYAPYSREA